MGEWENQDFLAINIPCGAACLMPAGKIRIMGDTMDKQSFDTRAIHSGRAGNSFGALNTPIYQTSTFIFENAAQGAARFAQEEEGYIYTRLGNPTAGDLQRKVADLENGEACVATASGMGAITSVFWSFISGGDHILAAQTLYGCTFTFLSQGISKFNVDVDFVNFFDLEAVRQGLRENTKIVYFESPANPNMYLVDIKAVCDLVHEYNPEILVVVDNTYCTPYITKPLDLGADIVIHSATKYMNGHSDVIAGLVVTTAERINTIGMVGIKDMTGAVISPFDAFLIDRGLKTLPIRMEKHCSNAQKVAEFLEKHPAVERVYYPGLPSFPQYELAKKQMALPGAMMAFEVKGGVEAGRTVMDNVKLCTLAVSLGCCETLIEHPATMTHYVVPAEERRAAGIADGLVRLSVGLENADDLIADLDQALNLTLK